jgi:hypothetical protein
MRQSYSFVRHRYRPAVVHESIPQSLYTDNEKVSVLGVQQHVIPYRIPDYINTMHLSQVRNSINEAETVIRDSNGIVFDLSSMSKIELPAQKAASCSGFCTEEACMLMRFAGLHPETKSVLISGHDPMSLELDSSANITAQLIWYFLEAYNQCIIEDPIKNSHFTSYSIHLDMYDSGFKFYKSERTARWWVQILHEGRDVVFPCTYKDYQAATSGLISDRLIACTNASLEHSNQSL